MHPASIKDSRLKNKKLKNRHPASIIFKKSKKKSKKKKSRKKFI